MAERNELTLADDAQLQQFGVYTTEFDAGGRTMLTRQIFRDAQQDELDVYPTDETFTLTILAAIEHGTRLGLRRTFGSRALEADAYVKHIRERRPSQPDFIIDPQVATNVLLGARYRDGVFHDGRRWGMNKHRVAALRAALARAGVNGLITMEEFEQPLRLSGDVFMTPPWQRTELANNPFMVTWDDFNKNIRKIGNDDRLGHNVFRCLGRELLDEERATNADTHGYARDFLGSYRYVDGAAGLFSFDLPAAYGVVFGKWQAMNREGEKLPFYEQSAWGDEARDRLDAEKQLRLAQLAISDRLPHSWIRPGGRVVPPPRKFDF